MLKILRKISYLLDCFAIARNDESSQFERRRVCLIIFLLSTTCFLFSFTPAIALADEKPDHSLAQEIQDNKRLMNKLKQQLTTQQLKENEAMQFLHKIEMELTAFAHELSTLDKQIIQGEKELILLQTSLQTLNQNFQTKLKLFSQHIKAAYLFKTNHPLKLLLTQQNPYQLERLLHYYRYMEKHQYETLSQLLNEMHTLSVHQNELDTMIQKIKELKQAKLAVIATQKEKKGAQQKAIEIIKKDLAQTALALTVSQQNEKDLLSQISKIQTQTNQAKDQNFIQNSLPFFKPTPFTKAQGKLLWPIRKEPRPSLMSPFMIKAQLGESVHATYDGRVVFADRLRGFGLLVIIDHGEGYLSLYGQNQTLYKNVGDTVKRGEVIARVGAARGTSSESKDSGLYFEVRKNGKPENLVNWFN